MFISKFTSLLAASWALQTAAHGGHDIPSSNGGSLRQRSGRLFPRSFNVQCARPQPDLDLINTEFSNAAKISTYAQQNLDSLSASTYTSAFISKELLNAGITDQLKTAYGNGANFPATNPPNDYKLQVTCDDTESFCVNGYYASMRDKTHTMNICSAWFSVAGTPAGAKGSPDLISTSDVLAGCTGDSPKYVNLQDFWPDRAQSLLHEWTHTAYFTTTKRTIDYAYGVQKCLDLAAGSRVMPPNRERNTNGKPICPDKANPAQPGACDPNLSIDNADTLSIIAGGLWFSDPAQCNRAIPIGLTAAPPPSRKRQATTDGELILDPPFDGDGFDPGSCSDPVDNCCGDCDSGPTSTSAPSPPSPSATALAPPSTTPTPPATPPPYATGTCSFHLTETQDCDTNYDNNLYANVVMKDNNKAIIGSTVNDADHPIGYSMNDGNPYAFISVLPNALIITGEHENDYVQFSYGSLSWQSKTPNGSGSCTVGGWDPRDGPVCRSRAGQQFAVCFIFSSLLRLDTDYSIGEQHGLQLPVLET
ncbi:MAG: hypothetical protein ASARMPRED_007178 [Alectoria sarmentosa]|nr:MAG: hypothetical protein ASARMPRED_007178 [Alectoria sarmentosa]